MNGKIATQTRTICSLGIWAAVLVLSVHLLLEYTQLFSDYLTFALTETLPVNLAASPIEGVLAQIAESGAWAYFALLTAIVVGSVGRYCLSDKAKDSSEQRGSIWVRRLVSRVSFLIPRNDSIRLPLSAVFLPLLPFAARRTFAPTAAAMAGAVPLLI